MTSSVATPAPRLSALRLVSFVTSARDAVRVGLLTPDANHIVDLEPLGITDALEAIDALDVLRQTAGAIIHGAARIALPVATVHLVAPIPLVRSVVQNGADAHGPRFMDPVTLHGPGGHISRTEAATAAVGLAAVVGVTVAAGSAPSDDDLDAALTGTTLVLGCLRDGDDGVPALQPVALGPFVAVPRRRPESLVCALVAPLAPDAAPDVQVIVPAPTGDAFFVLARAALRSHTLRAGDVLTIFPEAPPARHADVAGGSWLRLSAPGLGTLSVAVR